MERMNVQAKNNRAIDMIATGQRIAELRIEHGYSESDLQKFFGFALIAIQASKRLAEAKDRLQDQLANKETND